MRRLLAALLVSVFSFSLIGPALIGDADSSLPACCRRGGQHHCAMVDMDQDAAASESGPVLKAHADKCPYFPKGAALLPHSGAALLAASHALLAIPLSQLTAQSQAEGGYRISLGRSHQKRGPPALLS
jgi:hypothetical protein